jgi:hypothetical protein
VLATIALLALPAVVTAQTIGSVQTVSDSEGLFDIACPSSSSCLAVGVNASNTEGAIVPITNGAAGPAQSVTGTDGLIGIACSSGSTCFGVGETSFPNGVIVQIVNGTAGAAQTIAGTFSLNGVACASSSTCFAVGTNSSLTIGVIVPITNGKAGAVQTVAGTRFLNGIACPSSSTCYAAGENGAFSGVTVPIINGTPGVVQIVPGATSLEGVTCASSSTCFAVGGSTSIGVIVAIVNGIAGTAQTVSGSLDLVDIACPTANTCFATGQSSGPIGSVVAIANGTSSGVQTVKGTSGLGGIACPISTTCFAVGGTNSIGFFVPLSRVSTVSLSSSPNPSAFGQQVTLTATAACTGFTATGTVTFIIDGNPAATQPVGGSPATATYSTSSLIPGSHTISASYSADANCTDSTSNVLTQTVKMVGSGLSLASSQNPSAQAQPVNFTATVTCPNFTPTGTVTFTIDGVAGTPVTLSGGAATFTTSSLNPGSHSVSASYLGDANCIASTSSTLTQFVGVAGSTTTVSSSQNPSVQGQSVTFSATVACPGFTPTGTVTFTVDDTVGTAVTVSGGTATYTPSTLTAGSHSVTAAYSGDGNCGPASSTVLTQVVNATPVTEQPVGYGYCYPAANAPPPGAPCTPYTGTGAYQSPAQLALQYCQVLWQTAAQQQACIAQALGNVGGFICAIGCGTLSGGAGTGGAGILPARLPGAYCTSPDGSRQWVPQGAPAPSGCT